MYHIASHNSTFAAVDSTPETAPHARLFGSLQWTEVLQMHLLVLTNEMATGLARGRYVHQTMRGNNPAYRQHLISQAA